MNSGPPRPAPPPAARPAPPAARPAPPPDAFGQSAAGPAVQTETGRDQTDGPVSRSGHPAVDAALQGIANAAALTPADQIAQYDAAHRVLRETLATIDQS